MTQWVMHERVGKPALRTLSKESHQESTFSHAYSKNTKMRKRGRILTDRGGSEDLTSGMKTQ